MSIKLVYFDIRGRAEFLRMTLEAAGKKYEEERIQFADWPALKPKTPYGSLPYITYNGKTYGQSVALAQFVARECGLYGKSNTDGLRIGEVHGLWEDQLQNFAKFRFAKDDASKAEFQKKIVEEDTPKFFNYYENFLKDNGSTGFIVGKAVSLGDILVYDMIDNVLQLKEDALKSFPLLTKLRGNVEAQPKIKAYLAKRAKTPF